jgi:hypothetical protein
MVGSKPCLNIIDCNGSEWWWQTLTYNDAATNYGCKKFYCKDLKIVALILLHESLKSNFKMISHLGPMFCIFIMCKLAGGRSTVVEHSPSYRKVKASSPNTGIEE